MTRVPSAQHPLIAREGRVALIVTSIAGITLYVLFGAGACTPALLALLFLCFYFRDPHRDSPSLPLALVAPVDGMVTHAGALYDPWLGREAAAVSIVMGLLDVHSMFSPLEGKIIEQWSEPRHLENPTAVPNHVVAYLVRTDEGDEVTMEIARGRLGGVLRFYYQPGERIGHGRRIGYATLGCRITTYAACGSWVESSAGARVAAATSVVATLVHEKPVSALREPVE